MSPEKSHLRGRFAILLCVTALIATACDRAPSGNVDGNRREAAVAPVPTPVATPPAPAVLPDLARKDLILAAEAAASAYALGQPPGDRDPLVGRSFKIRLPFGCGGPTDGGAIAPRDGLASWAWGPDRKTIVLGMTPADWRGFAGPATGPTETGWEAVEGFWVARPWLTADACPRIARDPAQPAGPVSNPTLGIAAVFETGGSRTERRNGRAYAFTVRPEGDTPLTPPADGYRMLLAGRVVAFPDGKAIRCRSAGPDVRPVCIIATKLDRIAFETADGDLLTEWRPG